LPRFVPRRSGRYSFACKVDVRAGAAAQSIALSVYEGGVGGARLVYSEWTAFGAAVGMSVALNKIVACVAGRTYSLAGYYLGAGLAPNVVGNPDETYLTVHRLS